MYTICRASFCAATLISALSGQLYAADQAAPTAQLLPTVHVSGGGTVKVVSDVVFVSLTMTAVDDDLLRVRLSSDKTARDALEIAKKNGAAGDDVVISRVDLSLDFNKQLNRQIYQVGRDATIKLSDLSKLDSLLADLLKEPNLTVVKISFDTSKQRQNELDALSKAVADAREQAELLAKLHGYRLGKATDIRIDNESEQPFVTSVIPVVGRSDTPAADRAFGHPKGSVTVAADTPVASAPATFQLVAYDAPSAAGVDQKLPAGRPFSLGQISIGARVSVDYELIKVASRTLLFPMDSPAH